MESYTDLIYENIPSKNKDHTFGWGKLGEFKVMIMDNGFINATELCKQGGKELKSWTRLDESKNYIRFLDSQVNICTGSQNPCVVSNHVIKVTTNDGSGVRGTYVSDLLIVDIASWVSNTFKVRVATIVKSFYLREYKEIIRVKDTKIDELLAKVDTQGAQIAELLGYAKNTTSALNENKQVLEANNKELAHVTSELISTKQVLEVNNKELKQATQELINTKEALEDNTKELIKTKDYLKYVCKIAVIGTNDPKNIEVFLGIFLNNSTRPGFPYYILRGKISYVERKRSEYSGREIFYIECSPNSQAIFDRMKEYLGAFIETKYNHLSIGTIPEHEFVDIIKGLHKDKDRAYLAELSKKEALELSSKSELRSWIRQKNLYYKYGSSKRALKRVIRKC